MAKKHYKAKYVKRLREYVQELKECNDQLNPERRRLMERKVNKYTKLLGFEGDTFIKPQQ